MELVRTTIL